MIFIETSVFTRQITELVDDASYAELQQTIAVNPKSGSLIPGSGGLRKLRWKQAGGGKRGGLRLIYYWHTTEDLIFMLLAYAKNTQVNLSPQQLSQLRKIVSEEFNGGR